MELYRNQLQELECHLLAVSRDHSISPQSMPACDSGCVLCEPCCCVDIIDILQVQYKPFLLLAAQLQTIHERVEVYGDILL